MELNQYYASAVFGVFTAIIGGIGTFLYTKYYGQPCSKYPIIIESVTKIKGRTINIEVLLKEKFDNIKEFFVDIKTENKTIARKTQKTNERIDEINDKIRDIKYGIREEWESARTRCLIFDDDMNNSDMLSMNIKKLYGDITVHEANEYDKLKKLVDRVNYDIFFIDLYHQNIKEEKIPIGYEAYKYVRIQRPMAKVFLYSAMGKNNVPTELKDKFINLEDLIKPRILKEKIESII